MSENIKDELIKRMNHVLACEIAGIIQYMNHKVMLTGPERQSFEGFFHENSEEAHMHAEQVADRITALGGIPTVEPARVRQATDLQGMLEASLALEEDALAAWEACLEPAGEVSKGLMFWIEEHVAEETEHCEELRKLAGKISFSSARVKGHDQSA